MNAVQTMNVAVEFPVWVNGKVVKTVRATVAFKFDATRLVAMATKAARAKSGVATALNRGIVAKATITSERPADS